MRRAPNLFRGGARVQSLVYIFIALAGVAVGVAAYFGLTFSPIEAFVTGLGLVAIAIAIVERTLRRRCHQHFGYGAKTLDRILRLQRFLSACRREPSVNLGILALDAGYADQAHLSRETKELASLSPAEIRRQLSDHRQAA